MVGFCHLTDSHQYHHGQKPTMVGICHGGNMPVGHVFGSPAVQVDVEEDKLPGGEQTHLVSNQQELPDNKWFSPI